MVIKRNKQQQQKVRIGSGISRQDPPASTLNGFPTLQIFSFMAQRELRAQVSDGETLSVVLRFPCATEQPGELVEGTDFPT